MGNDISQLEEKIVQLEGRIEELENNASEDQLSMVLFSGELDRALAAFIIAVAAAAMYERVVMFITFWGINALRDKHKKIHKDQLVPKMFAKTLPAGAGDLKLSHMNMLGIGTSMMKSIMKKKNVLSLEDLIRAAADFGVEIVICEMSMDLMGFKLEEMIDYPNITVAGAATFLGEAGKSKVTLFI